MAEPLPPDGVDGPRSGLVTLLTDFGARDPYVGVMKGVVHATAPGIRAVIDLCHELEPQDVAGASFFLLHAHRWFPPGTVHVAVVDPGVGSERPILAARHGEHLFLAPDNGLLAPLLESGDEVRSLALERVSLPERSRTFHGRDVFAPAAARLAAGMPLADCGERVERWEAGSLARPEQESDGGWRGEVLLVDRFGNLVTNLGRSSLDGGGAFAVEVAGRSIPVRDTYSAAAPGELLALVDSYDLIEVAARDADASRLLGSGRGTPVRLRKKA